ncbi:potassium channel family protein [Pseudobacteroides cellulosolvens]|uniref:Trk system potassium uptake protein TrkA n=1 Tax=Pseudobacteroides cellulosolvens ATCC 35603 = DSM 2933 TaxID=398512 RepID=A0A0L6JR80_9FIRM|nr:TrkA family potassium uptake protein [Pseudobacteroides cellulosolvens]KNY28346.1 TrkA-N domain protein [Pseudobacteroides cellulosolvens ATCC 35603 = DSM 2933]
MYVVIVGGGKVGFYLAKTLIEKKYEVTLVDWDFNKAERLKYELGECVMYASGSSIDGLEKAGCSRADVIVAATSDDEDNLVICQLGKKYFNVPKAVARISNPKNERIFAELGVGTTISGTSSIAEAIERYVAKQQLTTLLTFDHNEMVLLEAELEEDSPVVDKSLSEITLPYECVIALVLRGRNVLFAKGNTVLKPKDMVIAISTQKEQENLRKILLGDPEV